MIGHKIFYIHVYACVSGFPLNWYSSKFYYSEGNNERYGQITQRLKNSEQILRQAKKYVIYMVDSHESDAYRQKNDFVAQSWIFQFILQTYGTFTKNVCELLIYDSCNMKGVHAHYWTPE